MYSTRVSSNDEKCRIVRYANSAEDLQHKSATTSQNLTRKRSPCSFGEKDGSAASQNRYAALERKAKLNSNKK
jgi:hypothetical protein